MEQLVIRGENLGKIREIVSLVGGYTTVKQIVEDDNTSITHPVVEGTCSACPHFIKLEGKRTEYLKYGECGHQSMCGAKTNMYNKICSIRRAELEVKRIEEE